MDKLPRGVRWLKKAKRGDKEGKTFPFFPL